MSDISWIKLKTEIFSDDKIRLIESLPEADTILIIWLKLLVQAGKTNGNGYIYLNEGAPISAEMISILFNRPLPIVRHALKILSDFGMISIDEGGLILIANWTKHQNIEGMEKIREQTRLRVAKYRDNKKLLPLINKDKDIEIDKEECVTCNVTESKNIFEIFRKKYPGQKRGLDTEFESFIKRTKDWKEVIKYLSTSIDKQIEHRDRIKNNSGFIPEWKHLSTWINKRCWEEELPNVEKNSVLINLDLDKV